MKKLLILTLSLLFSQVTFAAAEIRLVESNDIFTFQMSSDYLSIHFFETEGSRRSTAQLRFTSSAERKFVIIPDSNSKLKKPIEVLAVISSSGQVTTRVEFFIPGQVGANIRSSQTNAICAYENTGDFLLTDEFLKSHLSLATAGNKTKMRVKIGTGSDINNIQYNWVDCFDF